MEELQENINDKCPVHPRNTQFMKHTKTVSGLISISSMFS